MQRTGFDSDMRGSATFILGLSTDHFRAFPPASTYQSVWDRSPFRHLSHCFLVGYFQPEIKVTF